MIHVLYVDDEPSLLELGSIYLEELKDFKVSTALSAKEALRMLSELPYDAIISDYLMPEMDGIGLLKKVRAHHQDIPFILFTGKGREEVVIDAINNGADFYLQKGGNPQAQFAELAHKVRQAVHRRRTEQALRLKTEESEHFYSLSLDLLSIGDFQGRFVRANKAWEMIMGYTAKDLEGRLFQDLIHPDDVEGTRVAMDELLSGNRVMGHVNRFRAKDGSYHWIEWCSVPFEGKFVYSTARDITERKLAEEELKSANEELRKSKEILEEANRQLEEQGKALKSQLEEIVRTQSELKSNEQNFRNLIENAPEAIYLAAGEMRFAYVNSAAIKLFGASSADQLLGTRTLDRIHPSLHPIVLARISELTVDKKAVETLEEAYVKMDGTPIDVEVNAVPLTGMGDINMMIILRDISARKRAQEALARS
jgi:PAS domain S-box-containing protein